MLLSALWVSAVKIVRDLNKAKLVVIPVSLRPFSISICFILGTSFPFFLVQDHELCANNRGWSLCCDLPLLCLPGHFSSNTGLFVLVLSRPTRLFRHSVGWELHSLKVLSAVFCRRRASAAESSQPSLVTTWRVFSPAACRPFH